MLSHLGLGSRKEIKQIIRNSEIRINGKLTTDPSSHLNYYDHITINGEEFHLKSNYYFMMNKPKGCITSTNDPKEKTVLDYLSEIDRNKNPFPVGRLDKDTEGLIFLTTDGKLAHDLLSPVKEKQKLYYVEIDLGLTEEQSSKFKSGIQLDDGYTTLPAKIENVNSIENQFYVSITEGKFHQIKRMFQAMNRSVLYLKRLSIHTLKLDPQLKPGEYRELTDEESNELKGII